MVANRTSSAYALEDMQFNSYPQKTTVAKPRKKAKKATGLFFLINVLVAFLVAGTIVVRYASITELSRKNIALQNEYQDIQAKNRILQISINSKQDSKTVEEIATTRLSMVKPEKYQVVYVQTPKKEGAKVMSNEKNGIESFVASIGKGFSDAVAYSN